MSGPREEARIVAAMSRRPLLEDAAVFVSVLATYLSTLHPSVPGGDSGELMAVACSGGIAHPPGYPLYTVLARLTAWLVPFGTIAWRLNVLSALCNAVASVFLRRWVAGWTGSRPAGLLAAGLFAVSPLIWTWSVVAEVFALNNLFAAMLLWLAWRWSRERVPRVACIAAFVFGLGMSNHHTLVFLGAPLGVWMLLQAEEHRRRVRSWVAIAVAFGAGLSPYLYLPIATIRADLDVVDRRMWGDPATVGGFLDHLLRRDYGTFRLGGDLPAGSLFRDQLHYYLDSLARNLTWPGVLLASIGVAAVLWPGATEGAGGRAGTVDRGTRRGKGRRRSASRGRPADDPSPPTPASRTTALVGGVTKPGRWFLACWLFYVTAFHYAANLPVGIPIFREVTARFWQQPNLIAFGFAGLGLATALRVLRQRLPHPAGRASGTTAAFVVVALLILVPAATRYPTLNESKNFHVRNYGLALLDPLPDGAVLLTKGDLVVNSVRYLQLCEGTRTDVRVIDQEMLTKPWHVSRLARRYPDLHFPGSLYDPNAPSGFDMNTWLQANDGREIWLYPGFKEGDPSVVGHRSWPVGFPERVDLHSSDDGDPGRDAPVGGLGPWMAESRAALDRLGRVQWPDPKRYGPGTWERIVLADRRQAPARRALRLLEVAIARGDDPDLLDEARTDLEAAVGAQPAPPWHVWKNLGIVYDRLRATEPELLEQRDAAWHRFLESAPADAPDRAAIGAAVGAPDGR